jgi:hypothetical protein
MKEVDEGEICVILLHTPTIQSSIQFVSNLQSSFVQFKQVFFSLSLISPPRNDVECDYPLDTLSTSSSQKGGETLVN